MILSTVFTEIVKLFKSARIESYELDASVLISRVLGTELHKLIMEEKRELSEKECELCFNLAGRRISGEPVAYIIGVKEFYSLEFIVNKNVLIPRPETELLVDLSIFHAKNSGSVLDIGTGSGAVAIALKYNRPDLSIQACDISNNALKVAKENAKKILKKDSIKFSQSDIFSSYYKQKFNLIVTNPPYIDLAEKKSLQKEILFEPETALFADERGKAIIKKIILESKNHLTDMGIIITEIGYNQENFVKKIGEENSYSVSIMKDYAKLPRVAILIAQ